MYKIIRSKPKNEFLQKVQPVEVREDVDGGEGAELKRDDEADGDGHAGDLRHAAPRGRVGLGLDRVAVDVDHHVPRHGRVALDLVRLSVPRREFVQFVVEIQLVFNSQPASMVGPVGVASRGKRAVDGIQCGWNKML